MKIRAEDFGSRGEDIVAMSRNALPRLNLA